ncbi:MAG: Hsp20/alpha crystallin family protein [Planctomycetaceae bacterium]
MSNCEVQNVECQPQSGGVEANPTYLASRPAVDLHESQEGWLLRAEMPGVDENHVEVTLERQVLTIVGTTSVRDPAGYDRQYGEFRARRYERSFRVPVEIDRDRIEAEMRHGLLTVRIPKAAAAQPTRVVVKGGPVATE